MGIERHGRRWQGAAGTRPEVGGAAGAWPKVGRSSRDVSGGGGRRGATTQREAEVCSLLSPAAVHSQGFLPWGSRFYTRGGIGGLWWILG